MRTIFNNTTQNLKDPVKANNFQHNQGQTIQLERKRINFYSKSLLEKSLGSEVIHKMSIGQLPDLRYLFNAFLQIGNNAKLIEPIKAFLPVLQAQKSLEKSKIEDFLKNKETRHELVSTENFKLVLNHWRPGKASLIHGHKGYSCLFKVLMGKLEEVRYTPDTKTNFIGTGHHCTGSIGYIDDSIAYHQVGNPYGSSAISIHAYFKVSTYTSTKN